MARVLVCGLINIETTLQVDAFPIAYQPVHYAFNRVHSSVSGVGFNVAKALHTLGHEVTLLALIGRDAAGTLVRESLASIGLSDEGVLSAVEETAQSIILYEASGRRAIQVDLKNLQEQAYPPDTAEMFIKQADLAALCNINYARPLLAAARARGVRIATDVHVLRDLHDEYNRDFMAHADILFMSDEGLPCAPPDFIGHLQAAYPAQELVIGQGARGAILAERAKPACTVPAVLPRLIVSTIGAGDALFSGYLHGRLTGHVPKESLRMATYFAGYKIGEASAAAGFLTAPELAGRLGL